jgi:dinuclear metal center YbgI/SA1388 family protein
MSTPTAKPASLVRTVLAALEKFAPLRYADKQWDNVGILIENPSPNRFNKILLTIDLTAAVFAECVDKRVEVVVSYHPFIFSGMKQLQLQSPHAALVMQTICAGMSVVSPHTAWDAAYPNGLNDWVARCIDPLGSVSTIQQHPDPNAPRGTGYGRVLTLAVPAPLVAVVATIKQALNLPTARVCATHAMAGSEPSQLVRKVAICAGSGSSVFKALREEVDLLFCGEMGHHDVLAAQAAGRSVVLVEHTNNERGFLEAVAAPWLREQLPDTEILVSTTDRDPLTVW